jgi:hypothetical protein
MPSYSPSTIERVGDIGRGLVVQTPTMNNTTALTVASYDLFRVYGRIRILSLDIEVVTVWSNDATTLQYYFDPSTPAVAAVTISAACTTVANLAVGKRVTLDGTALNTAAAIAASQCVSLAVSKTLDVGCENGVGMIGVTGAAAAQTSGTCRATLMYYPITAGAYAESAV